MLVASIFRLYVLWAFVGVATSVTKPAKRKPTTVRAIIHKWPKHGTVVNLPWTGQPTKMTPRAQRRLIREVTKDPTTTSKELQASLASVKVVGRRSRQVIEADPVEGVWSVWGEWSECTQTCGVGVSQRTRKCLPPPQNSPISFPQPSWAGYLPGGMGGSSMHPYHPSHQHMPHHSPPSHHNQGVSLYRNTPTTGGGGAPLAAGQSNPSSPFHPADYPASNQNRVSVYRSPYHAPSRGNSPQTRTIRRPTNPAAMRGGGGGSRRSTSREGLPVRRSSSIHPGQFGYGKVPFSLPLHRPSRQARHTVNSTDAILASAAPELDDDKTFKGAEEVDDDEPATTTTAAATTAKPHSHRRTRFPAPPHFPPLSSSTSFRRAFDWRSAAAFPYSPSRYQLSHRERAPQPGFGHQPPQPANVYPLQDPHGGHHGGDTRATGGARTPPPDFRCPGPEKEYRRCFSQVCTGATTDSRAEQCAAFNTKEFMDRLYNWEPFIEVGPDKQCELTCRPAGYRFYVRQAERARDGTPCFNVTSNDVCVEGRCLTEGCDGTLGSGSVIDKCGVCGGRDSSCQKVTGSFQNVTVPLGYHKILDIPAGATFINITERRASPNYLAMRSGTGASVVNGRWAVDPPGEYQAGGTTFTYARPRAQTEGEEEKGESLRAPGPTSTQLQLYIIFHQQNPGIDYEFYIPVEKKEPERPPDRETPREAPRETQWERAPARAPLRIFAPPLAEQWTPERSRPRASAPNRNARIPPRTDLPLDTQPPFVWRRGALSECSVSCGKGYQYREILCINRHTDEEVPDRKCDSAAKPVPEEEPCNTHACPPFWEASSWSECSVSCGPGMQQRQLQCRQSFGNRSTMVHPQRCANLTPPESTQACQLQLCSHWEVSSDWSTCSVDCGVGKRTRSVRCVSDQGNVVNDKECNSRMRPMGSEECNMGPCVTNWYSSAWSGTCSAQCGPGVQKREVVCLTRGGLREGEVGGDCIGDKPAEMKACNGGPCESIIMWYSSPWTQCNVDCGNGTQRRDVICVQKNGNDFTVVPSAECVQMDKPSAVQECEMGECQAQWFTTEWSACSRSCGKGLQMREVRCLTPDKKHSQNCDASIKPEQEQMCNTIPCSPQVTDENCKDRRHNCVMVVQARLCVYSYYKTACCASCTHSAQRAKRH
ncbi:thrombospondin type-1 domain-containing protein 4 isoform X2 [Dunckerocampus dactyliophorus]|uniref:thrombospondin type-1 domain-containing protein 4 isoform X2 n=1 Tax=Dunckerocampus dactyliophorus TaxID=161453 RepID=UPI00240584AA|nr:thrombospondin type-1 domain-containing protein 4 isoform X2 [Dunckerocampus dactyliophorus]